MTRSFKFSHYSRHSFPSTVSRRWTEVSWNLTQLLCRYHRKAFIKVESRDALGRIESGDLVIELSSDKTMLSKEPYSQILQKGGYSDRNPFVSVKKALVGSQLALYVESDEHFRKKEFLPLYTVGYHEPTQLQKDRESTVLSREGNEEELTLRNLRRLNIKHALEEMN